jgi:hypothetical protein
MFTWFSRCLVFVEVLCEGRVFVIVMMDWDAVAHVLPTGAGA